MWDKNSKIVVEFWNFGYVQTRGIAAVPGHGQHSSQEWLLLLEVPGQLVRENTAHSAGFLLG